MPRKLLIPAFVGLSVVLLACDRVASHEEREGSRAHTGDAAADAEAVRKVERDMLAAFQSKDKAKLAPFYADDAVMAVPGQPQMEGREAILAGAERDMKDPAFRIDFTADKVEASGDLAYSRGRYTVGYTDPQTRNPAEGRGTYVTVFRRQADGSWKVVTDVVHPAG
jgi:uncharacterized protein (TIGR02246 family)